MLPEDAYAVRPATAADAPALAELAALEGRPPLVGHVLVAEVAGLPTAALSPADGRAVADPYQDTAVLVAILRAHAASPQAQVRRRASDRTSRVASPASRLRPAAA
jgi:hypothetical protein